MPDSVTDGDFDALAAEYVLGTLDATERAHTHVLLGIDDAFAQRVKVWERRLGELHLMVEAVEPDWRVYERIKSRIGGFAANPFYQALGARVGDDGPPQPAPETAPAEAIPEHASTPSASQPDDIPPALPPAEQPANLWEAPLDEAPADLALVESGDATSEIPLSSPVEITETTSPETASLRELAASIEGLAPPSPAVENAPQAAVEEPVAAPRVPSLFAAAAGRRATAVEPNHAIVAQLPAAERTIPFAPRRADPPELGPAMHEAVDAERWRRSVRQWRALAMAMTLLALTLATLIAGLRNFPERLPRAVVAQFPALAGMPERVIARPRQAAPWIGIRRIELAVVKNKNPRFPRGYRTA